MSQLQQAITQLHRSLALTSSSTVPIVALSALGVQAVYAYEPGPQGLPTALAVTVAPGDPAMDATMVTARLRVYASSKDLGAETAQSALIATMEAIDLLPDDEFGRAPWSWGYDADLDVLLAQSDLPFLRDDMST